MHARGGLVELGTHLREPAADRDLDVADALVEPVEAMLEPIEALLEPIEALLEPVETGGGLHSERVERGAARVDLHGEVSEVPVAGGGEMPGRRGVGRHFLKSGLHGGQPCFEVRRAAHVGRISNADEPGFRSD